MYGHHHSFQKHYRRPKRNDEKNLLTNFLTFFVSHFHPVFILGFEPNLIISSTVFNESFNLALMGCGLDGNVEELADVAKASISPTSDAVVGINHTSTTFVATTYASFISSCSVRSCLSRRYTQHSAQSRKLRFKRIAADVQKFHQLLRFVLSCNPNSTTDYQTLSMARPLRRSFSFNFRRYSLPKIRIIWYASSKKNQKQSKQR